MTAQPLDALPLGDEADWVSDALDGFAASATQAARKSTAPSSTQAALPFDVEHVPVLDPVVDAVMTGLDAGESPHTIAKGLGIALESVRKHLTRHGHRDLLDALSAATPGGHGTTGHPGARLRVVRPVGAGRRPAHLDIDGSTPCEADPEQWFDTDREAAAVAGCRRCPVAAVCLRMALERREEWGVWGGLTATERKRVLAERAAR